MPADEPTYPITFRIHPRMHADLRQLAEAQERAVSKVITHAIHDYMAEMGVKGRTKLTPRRIIPRIGKVR